MPRFLRHLGHEAPETAEFWRFFGKKDERKQAHKLPLHLKDVIGALDVDKVKALKMPQKLKEYLEETTRWLSDPLKYDELQTRSGRTPSQGQVKWSEHDVERFVAAGKVEYGATPTGELGGARAFPTPEWEKERRRALWESFINDRITAVPTVRFRSKEEQHRILSKARWAALYDFAAYYDQIQMEQSVRRFHGTQWKGKWLQPTVLPMGFRPACAIAQALTWAIVEDLTVGTSCSIISYIDNVAIVGGSKDEVKLVAERFVQRCHEVGAVLNDETINIQDEFEFLGTRYNLANKSRCCTGKTRTKLEVVREYLAERLHGSDNTDPKKPIQLNFSKREMAAVIGLALYGSQVLGYELCNVYWVMRYWSETSAVTHWDKWEEQTPDMRRDTLCTLISWITNLAKNTPVAIASKILGPIDAILFVDASERGYGVVAVTGSGAQWHSGQWDK